VKYKFAVSLEDLEHSDVASEHEPITLMPYIRKALEMFVRA